MQIAFTSLTQIGVVFLLLTSLQVQAQSIPWIGWEEAVKLVETEPHPKKIFVSVYTDWCGWCKKMEKQTFEHPEVAAYLQKHFYMVKLNAEGKDPIVFHGKTFKFVPSGRRGYHEFAATLLRGKMSYPSVVFLNENIKVLSPVPGYQQAAPFLHMARYFGDNIYEKKDWKSYAAEK